MKEFYEYIEEGIVKKQSIDINRSVSLKNEAIESYNVLKNIIEKIGINNKNANYIIKNSYYIIMELIRSEMLLAGYNSIGNGAHVAEVSYLRELGFNIVKVDFVDQLRYFRNGILYYGKRFDKSYALKVVKVLDEIKNMIVK